MGYSVAVTLRSRKAVEQMTVFLDQHFRPWSEVTQPYRDNPHIYVRPDYDSTRYICHDKELAYDSGPLKIGFNCSTSSHVMFCYLRWMALKLGRLRPFKKKFGITESVPYTVYDGYDGWPVLRRALWEHRCPEAARFCLVDDVGFKPESRWWIDAGRDLATLDEKSRKFCEHQDKNMAFKDGLIHDELKRLDRLWKEAHGG